jgi:hypothetical protein
MTQRSSPTRLSATSRSEHPASPAEYHKLTTFPVDIPFILDEINTLRLETSKLDVEARQIKSKTARMKQIIHDRNCAIKKALAITEDREQNIKTASDSTLRQLRENIMSLKNTLESRQEELNRIMTQDKLAISDELHIELLEYFCEKDRLKQQLETVHEGEAVVNGEVSRLRQLIVQMRAVERRVSELQLQNDQLAEKSEAYRRGEERMESNCAAERIAARGIGNEDVFVQYQRELEVQIRELTETQAQLRTEIRQIHENDQQNRRFLQSLIDEQAEKIAEAISIQQQPKQQSKSALKPLRR